MANTIWPFIPFVALRGAQLFFAIIVLGLSGHIGSLYNDAGVGGSSSIWSVWFSLVTSLFTLIGVGFLLVAFFILPNFTAPLFCLGIDAFLWLFWLISLAGFADLFTPFPLSYGSCYGDGTCNEVKGDMAMIVISWLLVFATLVFSALWFYKERSGKTTVGNPEAGHVSAGAIGGAPAPTHVGQYPMQQNPNPTQQYAEQPYPPQAPGAPYQQPAHTGGTHYAPTA